jgi:hypothetical protein
MQLQVASKKYHEFECQSLSEAWYFLRRILHLNNPNPNSGNISYRQYRENKRILGMTFEQIPDTNSTGTNAKMGPLITFKVTATEGPLAETEQISEVFVNLIN